MPLQINAATSGSTTLTPTDAVTATLTLPSSTGTLLSTANPQSGGVIQVVNATYSTQTSSTSGSTYVDSGLSATITPKFSSSKILVLVSANGLRKVATTNAGVAVGIRILRNGSSIVDVGNDNSSTETTANGGISTTASSTSYLDSPATTSALTYKMQFNNARGVSDTVYVQIGSATSTITLLEIAA